MASVPRTISLAVWLAAVPGAWAAEPLPLGTAPQGTAPQGPYQTDIWGKVTLGLENGLLVGYASANNPCGFPVGTKVLEGSMQGRVLLGQFSVCMQKTSDCLPVEVLPVLGFYSVEEGSLTAYVRPKKGCVSPVLGPEGLVVLRSPAALEAAAERAGATISGHPIKRPLLNQDLAQAKVALERGDQLMREKKWSASVTEFERSIALGENSWVVFFGLGTAQLVRNQVEESIVNLRKAQTLNPQAPNIAYHLACAHSRRGEKKEALALLRQAVELGYSVEPGMQDPGLEGVMTGDPGFKPQYAQVMEQAFANARNPAGRRQAQRP